MTLTDDEARAIDEAARVLARHAKARGEYSANMYVRADGRVDLELCGNIERGDLLRGGAHPSPGEALRRLVNRG